jgi:hypothetical protein
VESITFSENKLHIGKTFCQKLPKFFTNMKI